MTKNDMRIVFVQQQVIMCWFVVFANFGGKWLKLLTIIFLRLLMGNNKTMTENYVQKIGWKMKLSWVRFHFWQLFVFRVLYFCYEYFLTILIGNNNKMSEDDVSMVWVQKQVIMCWFVNFENFRANWLKLLTVIFINRIDGKQQQNDRDLCAKVLCQKCSYLRLVSIFGSFSCLGSCAFVLSIF